MVQIPQVIEGAAPQGRRATPNDFGAQVGRATKQLGKSLNDVSRVSTAGALRIHEKKKEEEAAKKAADAIAAAEAKQDAKLARAEIALQLQGLSDGFETDPDHGSHVERFDAAQRELIEERAKTFKGREREIFERETKIAGERIRLGVSGRVRQRSVAAGKGKFLESLDVTSKLTAQQLDGDAFGELLDQGMADIDEAQETGVIGPVEAARLRIKFNDDVERQAGEIFKERATESGIAEVMGAVSEDGTPLSRSQRIDFARTIEDPDIRDSVLAGVKVRDSEEREARRVELAEIEEQSWADIDAGGGLEVIDKRLPITTQRTMRGAIVSDAEKRAAGKAFEIVTDPVEWDRIFTMRLKEPDKFARLDLWASREKLARAEFNEFRREQKALLEGTGSEKRALEPGDTKFANDSMRIAGIKDPATLASGRFAFERAARDIREREQRDLTLTEREDLFKRILATEILVPGPLGFTFAAFGEKRNIAELTPNDVRAVLENPDDELVAVALKALKKNNVLKPNEEQLRATIAGMLRRLGAPDVE